MRSLYVLSFPIALLMLLSTGKCCLGDDAISKAEALLKLGKYKDAQVLLTTAVEKDAKNASAHYLLGNALVGLGKNDLAETEYKRAVALDQTGQAGKYAQLALTRLSERAAHAADQNTTIAPSQASLTTVTSRQPQTEMIDRLKAECDARVAQINKDTEEKIQRLNAQMREDIDSNKYLIGGHGGARGYSAAAQSLKSDNSVEAGRIKKDAEKQIQIVKQSYEDRIKGLQ